MKAISKTCGLLMVLALLLAVPAQADHFLKQVTDTEAFEMMGQSSPATSDTAEAWLTDDRAVIMMGGGQTMIIRNDEKKVYFLDHSKKVYMESPLGADWLFGGEVADMTAEEKAQMEAMAQAMGGSMKATVTPTEETKKIGEWNTKKYLVDISMPMGSAKTQSWVTNDIEINYDVYNWLAQGMMSMMPGFEEVAKEMKKLQGVAVEGVSEVQAMGAVMKSTMKLLEYKEGDAPDELFDVPEGYTKQKGMGMGR